jgi:flagellin
LVCSDVKNLSLYVGQRKGTDMSFSINTNPNALVAKNAATYNNRALSSAMQQLSTGKRINSAKDDASGIAVSEIMSGQIRGLNMAIRNANDGVSLLQTAEGAMIEQTNMLQRMRELAVQGSNDTITDTQKGYLNTEFTQLRSEIDRIGSQTKWNGQTILTAGTGMGNATGGTYSFMVGSSSSYVQVSVANMASTSGANLSAVSGSSVSTAANAVTAIDAIDTALQAIASQRATIGAGINRLTYAVDNMTNVSQNLTESRSRISDTDYATAASELARTQIIQQASTAMLAQANQQPQAVLALLK